MSLNIFERLPDFQQIWGTQTKIWTKKGTAWNFNGCQAQVRRKLLPLILNIAQRSGLGCIHFVGNVIGVFLKTWNLLMGWDMFMDESPWYFMFHVLHRKSVASCRARALWPCWGSDSCHCRRFKWPDLAMSMVALAIAIARLGKTWKRLVWKMREASPNEHNYCGPGRLTFR